jgi:V/A-type H+-transporting ATPase subunit A
VPEREGTLTVIAAISPPGGDFSEPVTQASLQVAGALWALDPELAHQRQFPAVDWETSYSLYAEATTPWFSEHAGKDWPALRQATLELLQRARELREIAALVGPEALQDSDRLLLEVSRIVHDTVLGQSAYDANDAISPVDKTYLLTTLSQELLAAGRLSLAAGTSFDDLDLATPQRLLTELRWSPATDLAERAAVIRTALKGLAQ